VPGATVEEARRPGLPLHVADRTVEGVVPRVETFAELGDFRGELLQVGMQPANLLVVTHCVPPVAHR
jgi:hypothetical protein